MGEYIHKVSAKGRVSLPAKFRKALAMDLGEDDVLGLIITLDPMKECLYVFKPEDFKAWVDSFFEKNGGFNARSREDQAARRELNRRAKDVEMDGSGRINIPPELREAVGIDDEASLLGNGDYFEIWNTEAIAKKSEEIDLASMLFD